MYFPKKIFRIPKNRVICYSFDALRIFSQFERSKYFEISFEAPEYYFLAFKEPSLEKKSFLPIGIKTSSR